LTKAPAKKALPVALKVPNADTRAAMEEARSMSRARFANADEMFHDLEEDHKH
jgi:DNA-damage-inducible protein J